MTVNGEQKNLTVVAFGPVSVGKSTLLNCLIGDTVFPVGSPGVPCTRQVGSWAGSGIEYVDTPGLFGKSDVTAGVAGAVAGADVALLVNRIDIAKGNLKNVGRAMSAVGERGEGQQTRLYVITDMLEVKSEKHREYLRGPLAGSDWENVFPVHLDWHRLHKRNRTRAFLQSGIPQLRSALRALGAGAERRIQ